MTSTVSLLTNDAQLLYCSSYPCIETFSNNQYFMTSEKIADLYSSQKCEEIKIESTGEVREGTWWNDKRLFLWSITVDWWWSKSHITGWSYQNAKAKQFMHNEMSKHESFVKKFQYFIYVKNLILRENEIHKHSVNFEKQRKSPTEEITWD